jgi:nucleoside-triphosphatase THEP1
MAETELMRQYNEEVKRNDKLRYTGFIAQEVEEAAKKAGFEFSGVDKSKNATDPYALRYAVFVVPLVKAVQAQQQIIKNQQTQIDLLIKRIEALEGK